MNDMDTIKDKIRTIPNFPKKGIMFRDITTLLQDPEGLKDVVVEFTKRYKDKGIEVVAGIEARGFIVGGVLAHELGVGFVPLRKKGKLPFKCESITYDLEYGQDILEIHCDAINSDEKVLIVDDLLATGGTCLAAAKLIKKIGGKVIECAFIVDLPDVGGRDKLKSAGLDVFSLVEFRGE